MDAVTPPAMTLSPLKRKRAAPGGNGELYVDTKRSRHLADDNASDVAASDVRSFSASNTLADTETPMTSSTTTSKSRPKKYVCTFEGCDKAFNRPIRLQYHINTHTGERPFVCQEEGCDKTFYKSEHLKAHYTEKHSGTSLICNYEVRDENTGEKQVCGKQFGSASKLRRHLALHEEKAETTCTWEGCGKVFRKQETLQRHIKKDHLDEDSYMCNQELPDGEVCTQSFPTPGQLRSHVNRAHKAPKYWCNICTGSALPPDMPLPIDNGLDDAFLPTAEDTVGGEPDAAMMDTLTLNEPVQVHVPADALVSFPNYHELQKHNTLCHPPMCNECGKKCKSTRDLKAHMEIVHSDDPELAASHKPVKKFVCPYEGCSRADPNNGFTRKGNVDQHVRGVHTKEKKFVCGETDLSNSKIIEGWDGQGCGLVTTTKASLEDHVRTQHMRLPTAKNKNKRKAKATKQELDEDEDMDMNEIPDAQAPTRAVAMITGHGYEQLRPYPCLLSSRGCRMRFTKEYELASHLELTHGWNVDDINDALENPDNFAPDEQAGAEIDAEDQILRQRLEAEMGGCRSNGFVDPQLQTMQI